MTCKADALRLISKKSYHSHELAKKLKEKEHTVEEIKSTISYLRESGYLNDEEFLKNFTKKSIERGWGPAEIRSKLYQKGIKDSIECDEKSTLEKVIKKKKYKDVNHLKQTLYRKGFSSDIINDLLGND